MAAWGLGLSCCYCILLDPSFITKEKCVSILFLFETSLEKREEEKNLSLLCCHVLPFIWFRLIYDTDLWVFSFAGFHGDPDCQI